MRATTPPRPVLLLRWCALTLGAALLTTACSPDGDPTRWEADEVIADVPAIDWPLGVPDLSNEWTATIYRAEIAAAAARNAADYSTPALKDLFEDDLLTQYATQAADVTSPVYTSGGSAYLYAPGPPPLQVVKLTVDDDEATAIMCYPSASAGWFSSGAYVPPTLDDVQEKMTRGQKIVYTLHRDAAGVIRLSSMRVPMLGEPDDGGCDLSRSRPGFFDPAPPYGTPVPSTELLGPDGVVIPNRQGIMPDGLMVDPETGEPDIDPETGEQRRAFTYPEPTPTP